MYHISNAEICELANALAERLAQELPLATRRCYPIPRGGIPAAYALAKYLPGMIIVDTPEDADFFMDDLVDSGSTMSNWQLRYSNKPFYALITKAFSKFENAWIVFPWEGSADGSIEDNIIRLLQFFGEDPARGGLQETPKRVAKAWQHWTSGYSKDPKDILKVFEDGADRCDEMVVVRDIPFYSQCEHHLAPFFGTATVAYIPNGKIVGLSKLSRLVDIFARRLQVQERFTNQVADALVEGLDPKGVGVVIQARHLCMESRGICQQGHSTVTSALRGVLKDTPSARAEFLSLASHK